MIPDAQICACGRAAYLRTHRGYVCSACYLGLQAERRTAIARTLRGIRRMRLLTGLEGQEGRVVLGKIRDHLVRKVERETGIRVERSR